MAALSSQDMNYLFDNYERLTPQERLEFEEAAPAAGRQARARLAAGTPPVFEADPWLTMAAGGVMGGGVPIMRDPERQREVSEGFQQGARQGLEAAAPMALGAVGGLGGAAVGARVAGLIGRGARLAPVVGEAAGSLAARKMGTATGLEEPGVIGDIAAGGLPVVGGVLGQGFRSVRQWLAPPLPEEAAQVLRQPVGRQPSPAAMLRAPEATRAQVLQTPLLYEQGQLVQEGIRQNRELIRGVATQVYAPVAVPIGTRTPFVNLQPAEDLATRLHTTLDDFGAETVRGVARAALPPGPGGLPFAPAPVGTVGGVGPTTGGTVRIRYEQTPIEEAIVIRSNLGAEIRAIERQAAQVQDRQQLRTLRRIKGTLDLEITKAARQAGVLEQLREADTFFREEVAERFYNQVVSDVLNASGEEVITRLPRLSVDDAKQYVKSLSGLGGGTRQGLQEGRAASVTALLAKATTREGVIRPDVLLNELERADPQVRAIVFGAAPANALYAFAKNLGKGRMRTSLAVGAVGELATLGTAAAVSPGAMLGAGVEVANELTLLGRLFVNRPFLNKAMVAAILTGKDEALRRMTGLQTARIVGTQAVIKGAPAFGLNF